MLQDSLNAVFFLFTRFYFLSAVANSIGDTGQYIRESNTSAQEACTNKNKAREIDETGDHRGD